MAVNAGPRKLVWLIAALLIMTTSLAVANVYLLMGKDKDPKSGGGTAQATRTPVFVKVAPFTVNLRDDLCGRHLLYVGLSLQAGDSSTRDFLEQHMTQIRSRLLMLMSGQNAGDLMSSQGKQTLVKDILALFEDDLVGGQPTLRVDDVLFTEFIVQ